MFDIFFNLIERICVVHWQNRGGCGRSRRLFQKTHVANLDDLFKQALQRPPLMNYVRHIRSVDVVYVG